MKRVEFLARFTDEVAKNAKDLEEERISGLTNSDYRPTIKKKISYDPINVDLENVDDYLRFDRDHTNLNMKSGKCFCIRIPFKDFDILYQELMGVNVFVVSYTKEGEPALDN